MHFKHEQISKYDEDYTIVGATPATLYGEEAHVRLDGQVQYHSPYINDPHFISASRETYGSAPGILGSVL